MKLTSINIGKERTQQRKDYIETTGIYKMPVNEPVEIKCWALMETRSAIQKVTVASTRRSTFMAAGITRGGRMKLERKSRPEPSATT